MEQALLDDPPALLAAFRAFNRWLDEDWGFAYQDRIFAAPMLTLVDPDEAVKPSWSGRSTATPASSCIVPGPVITAAGCRSPADPVFDPFWGWLNEAGAVVYHGGDNAYYTQLPLRLGRAAPRSRRSGQNPFRAMVSPNAMQDTFADLLAHGLFQRFPNLRVASIETGSDWVFHLFEKLKKSYGQTPYGYPRGPARDLPPPRVGVAVLRGRARRLRELIGADHMLMGSD